MLPEVKYITAGVDLSTIDPSPISVESIDLAIARLKGARYWAQMREWQLAGIAVDGARQALAVAPQ
jgi:hypothetical protein